MTPVEWSYKYCDENPSSVTSLKFLFTAELVSGVALFTCVGEVEVLKPAKLHPDGPLRQGALKRYKQQ